MDLAHDFGMTLNSTSVAMKEGVAGERAQAHGEVSAAVYELLRGVVALHARLAGFLAQLRAGGFLQCSLASLAAVRCDSTLSLAIKVGAGSMLPAPKHRSHSDHLFPQSHAQVGVSNGGCCPAPTQSGEGKQLLLEAVAGLGALLLALERRIPGPTRERAVVAHLRRRGGAQASSGTCLRGGGPGPCKAGCLLVGGSAGAEGRDLGCR